MKGARIIKWGSAPRYIDIPELPPPLDGQKQLKVVAVGVPRVVQARAAGKHSSSANVPLPFDPSVDGVGVEEATGDLYYIGVGPTGGASLFSERVNVDKVQLVKLETGTDPVTVAALINPVASSWMALQARAVGGCNGRTVLILGATGASGRAAVTVAKSLGAGRVIGMGRSLDSLGDVEGLDERILIENPISLPAKLGAVDIILDYVGGRAAVEVMTNAEVAPGQELQYIHIGDLAGEGDLVIPSSLLNKKPLRVMGSGMGAWSKMRIKTETPGLVQAAAKMKRPSDVFTAPLADVEAVWNTEDAQTKRLVCTL